MDVWRIIASALPVRVLRFACAGPDPPTAFEVVGSRIGSGAVTEPGPLADGVYRYATRQVDMAGNVGPPGPELTVTIDTTPPRVLDVVDVLPRNRPDPVA